MRSRREGGDSPAEWQQEWCATESVCVVVVVVVVVVEIQ